MAENNWLWPCPYTTRISQYYTGPYPNYHSGLDISCSSVSGKAVVASKSGTVSAIFSGCHNVSALTTGISCSNTLGCSCNGYTQIGSVWLCNYGLGNAVYISHDDGTYSQYVHLSSISVYNGQNVSQGDVIGYVGSTGESTDYHLHFSLSTTNSASGRYNNNIGNVSYIFGNTYKIKNVGASKYLNIYGSNLTYLYNSINVTLWSNSGTNEQKWIITSLGSQVFIRSIIDVNYGLNVYRSGSPYNCNIYLVAENETDAMIDIIPSGSYYKIKLHNYNYYLTVNTNTDGANVYWAGSSTSNYQKWAFTLV